MSAEDMPTPEFDFIGYDTQECARRVQRLAVLTFIAEIGVTSVELGYQELTQSILQLQADVSDAAERSLKL